LFWIADDIIFIFDVPEVECDINEDNAGELWDDEIDFVTGGRNYAEL